MSVGFVLTNMVLTTEEKVFIVERYFWSYGVGRQNWPSLHHIREHYKEQFNKSAPSNETILTIAEKFHRMGSILSQRSEQHFGDRLIFCGTNSHSLHTPCIWRPQMSTHGACWQNPFIDYISHLEMFPNYGRR